VAVGSSTSHATSAGIALWTIYGCYTGDCPLIVANLVTLVPEGIVLERKLQAVRATRK
jgi:MtN3 and saliva related transmembrane protein